MSILEAASRVAESPYARWRLRGTGVSGFPSVVGKLQIRGRRRISLGRSTYFRARQFPIQLSAGPKGRLEIGDNCFINQGVNIYATVGVAIGDHAKLADLVSIHDTIGHAISPSIDAKTAPIRIGRNVWIGRAAYVLPGVTIGDNSVVAAGAVVTEDVEANTVVGGVPARLLQRFEAPVDWIRM